jgi:hypothetical protein
MEDTEIWKAATLLVTSDTGKAFVFAAQRANELLAQGNAPAATNWVRIARAVENLQRQRPLEGEAIH